MSDPHPLKVGDVVSYVRHSNGDTVTGVVAKVISQFELHPGEQWSYHLAMRSISPPVGHAVTIGASRCRYIPPGSVEYLKAKSYW